MANQQAKKPTCLLCFCFFKTLIDTSLVFEFSTDWLVLPPNTSLHFLALAHTVNIYLRNALFVLCIIFFKCPIFILGFLEATRAAYFVGTYKQVHSTASFLFGGQRDGVKYLLTEHKCDSKVKTIRPILPLILLSYLTS